MRKLYILFIIAISLIDISFSQGVGIGTITPNASAALEIKASNKGLLIPRTSAISRTAISNPAKGLMVYDTTTSSFWYHNGTAWTQIQASGNGWSLTGNAGTNPAANFIGTTDAQSLLFKVKNQPAGLLTANGNTFLGLLSGYSNASGFSNAAIGANALYSNTNRSNLVAIGDSALFNNGTGSFNSQDATQNTAIGSKALFANTTGFNNTATGYNGLMNNITGSVNTANGYSALAANTTGNANTASGANALAVNTTGIANTAMGSAAMISNLSGNYNVANGYAALQSNITGDNNTAIGNSALFLNTSGYSNVATGNHALFNNTTGSANIALGSGALYKNTNTSDLVAIGDSALYNNGPSTQYLNDALYNTAVGSKALYSNTIGWSNTAIGYHSLYSTATPALNTAIGAFSLAADIGGNENTAIGSATLSSNINGSLNTATGAVALNSNDDGSYNTADGAQALTFNTSGTDNTANGRAALFHNTTGSYNTGSGSGALDANKTGNYNSAFGESADVSYAYLTNATAIGANAKVGTSNTIQLGDANVTSVSTYGAINANGYRCKPGAAGALSGNVFNIYWSAGVAQLWIDETNLGTISVSSDRRLKENIDLMKGTGIERMMELKPVHFKYKKIESTIFSGNPQEQEGFIADELQQIIPSAVNGEKNALTSKGTIQPQTINIVPVVAVLTKAVQEQQVMIETLQQKADPKTATQLEINEQQSIIQKQNNTITNMKNKLQLQQQQINRLLSDVEQLKQKINTPVK